MRPFPKLMCLKESPETVVFFADEYQGIVVNSNHEDWPFGKFLDQMMFRGGSRNGGLWHMEEFEDVPEDVIIWLTEGDQTPIYDAIALVDKINSLREAEAENPS